MLNQTKAIVASIMACGALAGAAPALAANQAQDGLVNVAVGDVTVQDVHIGVAAQIAANVCGLKVGPLAVLATQVDRSGATSTACSTATQTVRFIG